MRAGKEKELPKLKCDDPDGCIFMGDDLVCVQLINEHHSEITNQLQRPQSHDWEEETLIAGGGTALLHVEEGTEIRSSHGNVAEDGALPTGVWM